MVANSKKDNATKIIIGVSAAALIIILYFMFIATSKISEIKTEEFVGKTVSVSGVVSNRISIGDLSGYTLEDATGSITVSSEALPIEGATLRITGVVMKNALIGYYIKID